MSTRIQQPATRIYFTDFFDVSKDTLAKYGAFNVACAVDLPLFIDPFLLFTSHKQAYQKLHDEIINYLCFLRDKSVEGNISTGLLKAWYCFPEVRQNKLGFCLTGKKRCQEKVEKVGKGVSVHICTFYIDFFGWGAL